MMSCYFFPVLFGGRVNNDYFCIVNLYDVCDMKQSLLSLLFLMVALPMSAQKDAASLSKSYQQSAFALFNALAKQETDNVCFSPLSVQIALSMAQNGASGNTLKQLQQALGTEGFTNEEIGQFNGKLTKTLTNRPPFDPEKYAWYGDEDPEKIYNREYPQCELANSLWTRPDVQLYDDFVQTLRNSYDAGVDAVYFDTWEGIEKINAWANERTHGLIPYIYREPQSSDLDVVLANALYFKGSWTYEFEREATSQKPFFLDDETYVNVDMMCAREVFNMAETPSFYAVTLYYGMTFDYSMTLFVPIEGTALPPLTYEDWYAAMQGKSQPMNLYVPRFQIDGNYPLKKVLQELGVTDAFDYNADFTKMSEVNRCVSNIFQLSKIQVDEKGTEAAAVTVMEFAKGMDPNHFIDFKVDRPFYFTIQSHEADAILFTGRVTHFSGVHNHWQDGISASQATPETSPCFDLQGRKLPAAPQKGFFIQNGRKWMR